MLNQKIMEVMRLVVTGPVGAGKSTFIRSVSEIEVVDTDRQATDETATLKAKTTVAFDFGRLQFGPDMALHLYGTPGQARFDFMWDILIQQAHAYMLLVAAHRADEFYHARRILNFMKQRSQVPMIIGLTYTDMPTASHDCRRCQADHFGGTSSHRARSTFDAKPGLSGIATFSPSSCVVCVV